MYFHPHRLTQNWNCNNTSEKHLQDFKSTVENFKGIQTFVCSMKHRNLSDLEVNKTKTPRYIKVTYEKETDTCIRKRMQQCPITEP